VAGSPAAGRTITVTDTTVNQGAGNAVGPFSLKAYLSADGVVQPGATPVGSRTVSASGIDAGKSNSSFTVTIPAGFLTVVADADGQVPELSKANNAKTRALNVAP